MSFLIFVTPARNYMYNVEHVVHSSNALDVSPFVMRSPTELKEADRKLIIGRPKERESNGDFVFSENINND